MESLDSEWADDPNLLPSIDLDPKQQCTEDSVVLNDNTDNLTSPKHEGSTSQSTTSLAKKRLQAYSKQIVRTHVPVETVPEEKKEQIEKFHVKKDLGGQFKKREIKQRNYRRTDDIVKKSASPEDFRKKIQIPTAINKIPHQWSDINIHKIKRTKGDETRKRISGTFELLENLYNFPLPSKRIESVRCGTENGPKEVSPFKLKYTKSKPSITYSVNMNNIKDSFLSREQVFQLISDERERIIRKLINNHSRLEPSNKKIEQKSWYNKIWKKHSVAECTVIEKSVGLSFLQNYSDEDEEENETEEVIICSSIKANSSKVGDKSKKIESENNSSILVKPIIDEFDIPEPPTNSEDESGALTPEIPLQLQKSFKFLNKPEEEKTKVDENVDKKKKTKKKIETKSKKKKNKSKQKSASSDDSSDSSTDNKKSRKKRKRKNKKEKLRKIKLKIGKKDSTGTGGKSSKLSKKNAKLEQKKSKKHKKHTEIKSPLQVNDIEKKVKQLHKKKKLKLDINTESVDKNVEKKIEQVERPKHKLNLNLDIINNTTDLNEEINNPILDTNFIKREEDIEIPKIRTPTIPKNKSSWESDDDHEVSNKQKSQLNSSWESDEDERTEAVVEHVDIIKEKHRNLDEKLNLEIPLNIKPFTRRSININVEENKRSYDIPIKIEKQNRWDRKELLTNPDLTSTSTPISNSLTPLSVKNNNLTPTSAKNNSTPIPVIKNLENEYVEFLKAVTTNNEPSQVENSNNSLSPKDIPIPTDSTTEIADSTTKITSPPSPPKPKFTFTSLVLPSKKTLLDNSNLKLGDSDEDIEKPTKLFEEFSKTELTVEAPQQHIDKTPEEYVVEVPQEHVVKAPLQHIVEAPPGRLIPVVDTVEKFELRRTPPKEVVQESKSKSRRSGTRSPVKGTKKRDDRGDKRINSPRRRARNRRISPKRGFSPKRECSPRRRSYSPMREISPKRRRRSPIGFRDKKDRRYGSRRSRSPLNYRRRSPSPRRRSSRSISPRSRSAKRTVKKSETELKSYRSETDRSITELNYQKSPNASPLEGLKRSVADSTISDDMLLRQPHIEEYQSPISRYFDPIKSDEPKRISLDERLHMELGIPPQENVNMNDYENYQYNQPFVHTSHPQRFTSNKDLSQNVYPKTNVSSNFVQVGNMVQIVPSDINMQNVQTEAVPRENKSTILQVGNMLQIVPADLPPEIPLPPEPPEIPIPKEIVPIIEETKVDNQKLLNRRTEKEQRKKEREFKRREKENRRREKEKQRNIKMKQKTEHMIMKALQLEVEQNEEVVPTVVHETPTQWPPVLHVSNAKDILNKSILVHGHRKANSRKSVQFADGIKPGEGTSPSAGEELGSSPPSRVLPKEKRYSKTKLHVKNMKKKVKVKIIKNQQQLPSDDEDNEDNLPPPSPPPGSPPPHLFPPRIKTSGLGNVHGYIPNVIGTQNQPYGSQTLPNFQQLHIPSGQPTPPIHEPQFPVHHIPQYQIPPIPSSVPPPPPPESDSGLRNHLYKYST